MDATIDTAFPASENTPGQAVSRVTYRDFLPTLEGRPWKDVYLQLRAEGWDWRKAVFIAWSAMPSSKRVPKTQKELAAMLGLSGDKTFRNWMAKRPEMQARIEAFTVSLAGAALADVMEAWSEVAKQTDPKAHQDRITFLRWRGVYKPKAATSPEVPTEPVMTPADVSGLDDDQLEQLISNLQSAA
jgi:hypothetical protein